MAPAPPSEGAQPQGRPGWVSLADGRQLELASPLARLAARIIDGLLVSAGAMGVIALTIFAFILLAEDGPDLGTTLIATAGVALLILALAVGYEVSMISRRGQTIGKIVTKVKVIRTEDGEYLHWRSSMKRWAIPWAPTLAAWLVFLPLQVSSLFAVFIYVSLTWDTSRQGWHDKLAGTFVVKSEPRSRPDK